MWSYKQVVSVEMFMHGKKIIFLFSATFRAIESYRKLSKTKLPHTTAAFRKIIVSTLLKDYTLTTLFIAATSVSLL